ncbi:ATP-binding protein [Klebsiella quasipneumoniae subsp. similipneumoniae]|uniref:sensor histidine kinase n=1 Tax=Klebsiella pneumoniae complex TaxID=3390273 RepID=UPI0023803EDB|nr:MULTISPECIES: ATP-binding protein [Klebsiella]MDE4750035.1 ATP-binding protein [Klebsiella pneumoniae]MDE4797063.1 ATP-binding protein [Klebsiella quasipneumoniae subsp. similipneumoniae]
MKSCESMIPQNVKKKSKKNHVGSTRLSIIIAFALIVFSAITISILYCGVLHKIKFFKSELHQKSIELNLRVKRYEFIPYTLSINERITNFLKLKDKTDIDYNDISFYLYSIKMKTQALALYLLDHKANVIVSSDIKSNISAVGYNLSHRPYFYDVQQEKTIGYYGIGISSSIPGYYLANGIFANGIKIGAIVAKINLNPYISNTISKYHTVLLDKDYVVAFSSNPDWLYHTISNLSRSKSQEILKEMRYFDKEIKNLEVKRELLLGKHAGIAYINNLHYIYSYEYMPEMKMFIAGLIPLKDIAWEMLPFIIVFDLTWILIIIFIYVLRQRNQIIKLKQEKQQVLKLKKEKLEYLVYKRTKQLESEVRERKVTEEILRNTQHELLHNEKLAVIGQLSAGLAHEINQPLSAISMMSANALKLLSLGAYNDVRDNLERIVRSVGFIGRLSNQLKSFARPGDNSIGLVSVMASIDNSMLLISHMFKRYDCKFIRLSPDIDIWCKCNNLRLEQVIVNILSNALDAVKERAHPRIVTAKWFIDGDFAVIEIEDNGVGISPENLDSIFEPFFTTKSNHGLGLGLSISADIIKSYNGTLEAKNGKHGACFSIRLPLAIKI